MASSAVTTPHDRLADFTLVRIADVEVGDRYREDPTKDLAALAKSIDETGLLHPIVVVSSDYGKFKLVAGQRRLLACDSLGYDEIEAHVMLDLDEAGQLLAEHDENKHRVGMTTGEARKLWNHRKEILKPLAEAASQANLVQNASSGHGAQSDSDKPDKADKPTARGRAAEAAAQGTGKGRRTLENATKLAEAAEDESLPEDVRALAQELSAAVDADEKGARPAVEELQEAVAASVQDSEYRGQAKALKAAVTAFGKHADALEAAFVGAENFDADCDVDSVREAFKSLRAACTRINKVSGSIKDIGADTSGNAS
jgi:ParB family transcriptional regulator, chromosome partitioning protein